MTHPSPEASGAVPSTPLDAYDALLDLQIERRASFRVMNHPSEGRTEVVSAMRGNALRDAAKCLVLLVKQGKRSTRLSLP